MEQVHTHRVGARVQTDRTIEGGDRIVAAAIHLALGQPALPWDYWWAPLPGALLWPPLFLLLDALRLGRRGD